MKQVWLLRKWVMEVNDVGLKQAEAEVWRTEMTEEEGRGLAGGSRRKQAGVGWRAGKQAGRRIVDQE